MARPHYSPSVLFHPLLLPCDEHPHATLEVSSILPGKSSLHHTKKNVRRRIWTQFMVFNASSNGAVLACTFLEINEHIFYI